MIIYRDADVIREIKDKIVSTRGDILEFVLIGSYSKTETPQDLDIALVVADDTDSYLLMKELSRILSDYSAKLGLLVTCFPIKRRDYINSTSQFIKNIIDRGTKI